MHGVKLKAQSKQEPLSPSTYNGDPSSLKSSEKEKEALTKKLMEEHMKAFKDG